MTSRNSEELKPEEVLKLLSVNGLLSQSIKGFEARPQQLEMARDVVEAYNRDKIALIEAGTGTGKSLAYLLPAILWAAKTGERTVISTHTITLQEQLLQKDIPFLLKSLKLALKAVLVKGMHNYLCLRKLEDAICEKQLLPDAEEEEIEAIGAWAQETVDGSRADLPIMPSLAAWEKVGAEGDACNFQKCPHYKNCFYFKARKEASDAQILVVNHSLLCVDLNMRSADQKSSTENSGLLPSYNRLIIDEAHHLEGIATEAFASRVNRWDFMRLLAKLAAERKSSEKVGKLSLLRQKIVECYLGKEGPAVTSLLNRLEIDLLAEKQQLNLLMQELFQGFALFLEFYANTSSANEDGSGEQKWRLRPENFTHQLWQEQILPAANRLIQELRRYVQALSSLERDIEQLQNEVLSERTKSVCLDISAIGMRLAKMAADLEHFISKEFTVSSVRWIELRPLKTFVNMQLIDADLDISTQLHEKIFAPFPTVVLCSATLATKRNFAFIRKQLGITLDENNASRCIEKVYDSPFNFAKQALLVVPTDMPDPNDPGFTQAVVEEVWRAIQACRGQAFVLFTSFVMMRSCFELLKERLQNGRYPVLLQGEQQRQLLLSKFKSTPYSVLFGTDSFWEGVDVVGDALRCVIIVKLPFKVPSEPLIQARTETILAAGGNPFFEYTVPHAIVKFKQGFGRLIRKETDRGCIVCLDPRIVNKGYGKFFLDSLPNCGKLFEKREFIKGKMEEFYKKTYFLQNRK